MKMELKEFSPTDFPIFQGVEINKTNKVNSPKKEQVTETNSKKNTADVTNSNVNDVGEILEELCNFDNLSKKKIFKVIKAPKTKRGRPKKCKKKSNNSDLPNRKKGKYRKGNACYRILTSCDKKMHYFIKIKYKGLENLYMPNITTIEGKSHEAMRKSINKTLYDIYCEEAKPRRFKGDREINEEDENIRKQLRKIKYQDLKNNKLEIDNLLATNKKDENNKNDENEKNKKEILKLFKAVTRKDFLLAFLKDEKKITKNDANYGNIDIDLFRFDTYSQCFNGEYENGDKEKFKEHVLDILEKKSNDRITKL